MYRNLSSLIATFFSGFRLLTLLLPAALAKPGCGHEGENSYKSVSKPPTVQLIQPQTRTIVRTVGQPSFIEAYERTSVYPKLTGYIEKWNVDIGDKVKKGDVLATLFVPELVEDFGTKRATVKLDEERTKLAHKVVEVTDADVKAAVASLAEAKGRSSRNSRPRSIAGKWRSSGSSTRCTGASSIPRSSSSRPTS
jgi:hypothetical protein